MPPLLLAAALLVPAPGEPAPRPPLAAWDFGPADDRDFDRWPDGWLRRRGPGFPAFVPVELAPNSPDGSVLRFVANGGAAVAYSPPVAVSERQAVRLAGRISASGLTGQAAVVSLSLLDRNRVRIARFLTAPVAATGSADVTLGPIPPTAGAAWAVVGCHLVVGDRPGVSGEALFGPLILRAEPYLTVEIDGDGPTRPVGGPLRVRAVLSGLPEGTAPAVTAELIGEDGATVDRRPLGTAVGREPGVSEGAVDFGPRPRGLWRVRVTAAVGGTELTRTAAVAVADPADLPAAGTGRFGLSLPMAPATAVGADRLARFAAAAGAGRVRWPAAGPGGADERFALALRSRRVRPFVGLTAETFGGGPDDALIDALAARPDAAAAVARVAGPLAVHVREWQLGRDEEPAALSSSSVPTAAGLLRAAAPGVAAVGPPETGAEVPVLPGSDGGPAGCWRTVPAAGDIDAFVQSLIAAAAAGTGPVFVTGTLGPTAGLLTADGSPTARFLPFRTVAAALGGGVPLGAVRLPTPTDTPEPIVFAFTGPTGPMLAVWGEGPGASAVRLGGEPAASDLSGRVGPLPVGTDGRAAVRWSASPRLIAGPREDLLRWRIGTALGDGGVLTSSPDPQPFALSVVNPLPGTAAVTVTPRLPDGWRLSPPSANVRLGPGERGSAEFLLELPPSVSLGEHAVSLLLSVSADGPDGADADVLLVPRTARVRLAGLRLDVTDRRLPGGGWEVTQTVTVDLPAGDAPAFLCELQAPGAARVSARTGPLGPGRHVSVHRLPAAAAAGGAVWLRAAEVDGGRVLNRRWPLGSPPPPSSP